MKYERGSEKVSQYNQLFYKKLILFIFFLNMR